MAHEALHALIAPIMTADTFFQPILQHDSIPHPKQYQVVAHEA